MIKFTSVIEQAIQQGDKTGWSYIIISAAIAEKLQPGSRKSFRVKGLLDNFAFSAALLPIGEGKFMLPINATMRKGTGKRKGEKLQVQIEADLDYQPVTCPELMDCLNDAPEALAFFNTLTRSHQDYFIKWIESAKTEQTKSKRIAQTVTGLSHKFDFGTTVRYFRDRKDELGY
ncbi:YdeI/OmpD-associated family protein [Chitinophaga horti]|uniref:YdeI/OmpD-associated family protein n=1 Tax=Chitinophaga horti TaxID=2920382 RepID=A0ABY6IXM1_9BACT|nr:YdeI/OmpD-associated family protein [Chitinophaga horti]UYQ91951.1 YdeI/OmpD-associated family protein [Chitinophaga horti]